MRLLSVLILLFTTAMLSSPEVLASPALVRSQLQSLPQATTNCRYFPETKQSICDLVQDYWTNQGGLARFGYPLSPLRLEVDPNQPARRRLAQWFERARFEVYMDATGQQLVQLGLLGNEVTRGLRDEWPFQRIDDPGDGSWFPETGHTLRGVFRDYWEAMGGLPVYGFPISEPFRQVNPDDGHIYTVQYFERNRFEHHPELAGSQYEILLGQLGRQLYTASRQPAPTTVWECAPPALERNIGFMCRR